MKSTPEMRARIRELASPPRDDFDRAVLAGLDDLEHMLTDADRMSWIVKDYDAACDAVGFRTNQAFTLADAIKMALADAHAGGFEECRQMAVNYHLKAAADSEAIAAVNQDNDLGSDSLTLAADHRVAADDLKRLGLKSVEVSSKPATANTPDLSVGTYRR